MSSGRVYDVLFLCTGNSARSIMAEALLRRHGRGRFRAHSAGSHPTGVVAPLALEVLAEKGVDTRGLRSKSMDEYATPDAPRLDFVFTVCDRAAAEACPVWPGRPVTAHWGVEDPAAAPGSEDERRWVFRRVRNELDQRVEIFTNLRIEALDRLALQRKVEEIGKGGPASR